MKTTSAAPRLRHPPQAWDRLKQNKVALAGVGVVIVVALVAILAPWLAPDGPAGQVAGGLGRPGGQFGGGLGPGGEPFPPARPFLAGDRSAGRSPAPRLDFGGGVSLLIGV